MESRLYPLQDHVKPIPLVWVPVVVTPGLHLKIAGVTVNGYLHAYEKRNRRQVVVGAENFAGFILKVQFGLRY
jgi:hypothetical protein